MMQWMFVCMVRCKIVCMMQCVFVCMVRCLFVDGMLFCLHDATCMYTHVHAIGCKTTNIVFECFVQATVESYNEADVHPQIWKRKRTTLANNTTLTNSFEQIDETEIAHDCWVSVRHQNLQITSGGAIENPHMHRTSQEAPACHLLQLARSKPLLQLRHLLFRCPCKSTNAKSAQRS